jgi:raffinose/stachyose/melibiose transport system permease protein
MATKYAVLTSLSIVMMLPVLVAVLGGMRTTPEFLNQPFGLPSNGIAWGNFESILSSANFWRAARNSVIITVSVAIINVILGSMLAFVFSRVTFRTRALWFNLLSLGLLVPLVVVILPIFIQIRSFGLLGNLLGVILPMAVFGLPGSVVIMRGFFIAIPTELEDASYIDGASRFGFFWYILVPMARPVLAAVTVIQIILAWNEFFLPLVILTSNPDAWPLTLGLQQFQGQYGTDWARVMAYITILIIPAVVFYLLTQKYIVTGLTGGELKG